MMMLLLLLLLLLHSWNQKLEAHWHVHVLVPGEGPSLKRPEWKQATAPPDAKNSDGYYLVDADCLCEAYRKRAIDKLRRLRAAGKLRLCGKFEYLRNDDNWEAFVRNLESKNWVAYIQPPPTETSRADQVVKYLTRYLTGGPISERRIVSASRNEVTFMARDGKRVGGEREQIEVTLETQEFVRRWCLHIQPDQLTKTRYWGGWANNRQANYMSRCRELLELQARSAVVAEVLDGGVEESHQGPDLACEHCGSDRLEFVSQTAKPSWKELFWREDDRCPSWYAERQRESHRQFWTAQYGSDFYDWYLETQVESAKEKEPDPSPLFQPHLPGFWTCVARDEAYLVDSY